MWDLPPKIWMPPKPAIIRSAKDLVGANILPGLTPMVMGRRDVAPSLIGAYVESAALGATFSFGAAPVGSERRFMVACVGYLGADSSYTISIGGTNGTQITNTFDVSASGSTSGVFYREVSSGTSGVISAGSFAGTSGSIHVYRLITTAGADLNIVDFANAASGGTSESLNMDVLAGGFVLGVGVSQNTGSASNWSGLTEDVDEALGGGSTSSAASLTPTADEAPRAISVSHSSTSNSCAAGASFHFTPA